MCEIMFEFKKLIVFAVLATVLPSNAKPAYQGLYQGYSAPQGVAFNTKNTQAFAAAPSSNVNYGLPSRPVASSGFGQSFNYGSNVPSFNVPQYYQAGNVAQNFNIQTNAQPLNDATDFEAWKTQTSLENLAVQSAVNSLAKEAKSEAEDIRAQTQRQEALALYHLQNSERQHFAKSSITSGPDFEYIDVIQPNNPIDRQISQTEDVEAYKTEQKLENYAVQDSVGALAKEIRGEEEQLYNVEKREEGLAVQAMEIERQLQVQAEMEEARQRTSQAAERARAAQYVQQQAELQAVMKQRANQEAAINVSAKRVAQIRAVEAQQLAAENQRYTQIAELQAENRYKRALLDADQAASRLRDSEIALQKAANYINAGSNNYQSRQFDPYQVTRLGFYNLK